MASFKITGKFQGKAYSYSTNDYEWALKIFTNNNFKNLWMICDGKKKLIKANKV